MWLWPPNWTALRDGRKKNRPKCEGVPLPPKGINLGDGGVKAEPTPDQYPAGISQRKWAGWRRASSFMQTKTPNSRQARENYSQCWGIGPEGEGNEYSGQIRVCGNTW